MTLATPEPHLPATADMLAALHARVFADAWPAAAFTGLLQIPGSFVLVVEEDSEPCGFLVARVVADEAEIITIGVLPVVRRQGFGRRLLDAACVQARVGGARSLFLEVAAGNTAARALYARSGFTEVGRRPAYYAAPGLPGDDALVLRRDLVSGPGSALDDHGVAT